MSYSDEVLADSPAAWYRMDEASGQPQDSSGNARHTTATYGSATYAQAGALPSDPSGKSILVSGSQRFTSPDGAWFDLGNTFTLEAWVKRAATQGTLQTIIDKGYGAYQLFFDSDNKWALARQDFALIVKSTASAITDTTNWYHLVVTKSGSTVKLYQNGVDVTGTVTDSTMDNTTWPLNLFASYADPTPTQFCHGYFDELAVYPTALSQSRVQAHYGASTVGTPTQLLEAGRFGGRRGSW